MKNSIAILAIVAAGFAASASADVEYYTGYKNTLQFDDFDYVDNTAINDLRVGVQGKYLYLEIGASEFDGEVGTGFEAGYKYRFTNNIEIKGEVEGRQIDTFEGGVDSRLETEVRYFF